MRKTLVNFHFLAVFLLLVQLFLPAFASADGMAIKPLLYSDRWDYSNETNQQAYINYENGIEKMILSIGLDDLEHNEAVWIFPVPADPGKVAVNIVSSLPRFSGEEIGKKAKSNLNNAQLLLHGTQIYTLPFLFFYQARTGLTDNAYSQKTFGNGEIHSSMQDVIVYEHIEKEGVTSEIITTGNADALYNYLRGKGLSVKQGSIPAIDQYIGQNFSFVISWISSLEKILTPEAIKQNLSAYIYYPDRFPQFAEFYNNLKQKYPILQTLKNRSDAVSFLLSADYSTAPESQKILTEIIEAVRQNPSLIRESNINDRYRYSVAAPNQRGVFVTFPSPEIYFPLIPTSVYGSKIVPATIRIMGHTTPKIPEDIKAFSKITYYLDNNFSGAGEGLESFFRTPKTADKSFRYEEDRTAKYTKIEINAPSKYFTEDLWIKTAVPPKTVFSTFLAIHPVFMGIILLIISSLGAGAVSGLLLFKEYRNISGLKKFALTGLFNGLSIIALIIKTALVSTKENSKEAELLLNEAKQKGYFLRRKLAFILFAANMPFLLFAILLIPSLIHDIKNYFLYNYYHANAAEFIFFFALPMLIFALAWHLKKIKKEDIPLLSKLKEKNYSAWTFQKKDPRKISFIALFSVLFLFASWVMIKIIMLAV